MTVIEAASSAVAVLALLFAGRCYLELYRWARQCQQARIAIAFKGRVQLQAPLVEWLGWANLLAADEGSRGRVIYRANKVSVAILRPRPVGRTRAAVLRGRRRWASRKAGSAPAAPSSVREVKAS